MRVLLAGATGAIGRPLITALRSAGHEVLGVTSRDAARAGLAELGAEPLVADALDRAAVLRAVDGHRADAVVAQLTALGKGLRRPADFDRTNALRTTGTANLLAAAHALGATRFVAQSMILGYGYRDHGPEPLTEDAPFGEPAGGSLDPITAATADAERLPFADPDVDAVALRYGMFYGTADSTGMLVSMLRRRLLPVPRTGTGTFGLVHIDDAVTATVAALERGRAGEAYNIVDDEPVSFTAMLDAAADAYGAPRPWRVPTWFYRVAAPYFASFLVDTSMRPSNTKAGAELGWRPRYRSYREGFAAAVEGGR